jgi:serine/threonine protein kinase
MLGCGRVDLAPGVAFGPYRVVAPLGSGGMASVYKAYEEALDRHVALKVVHGAFLGDPSFAERFRREAKVVARLEHPHIVPIHAFGVEGGVPWMAMRLVTGGAVSALVARGRLAIPEVVRIVGEVASALDYAHGKGIVHRDVKPQNMLLDEGQRVYLADFGIARLLETSTHLTATGMIQGTPAYMAPEQATGQAVDARADVYALGIVAYEAFTGRVPFTGPTPVSILLKHVSEPLPRPPASELPAPVTTVLERCLAKAPDDRFSSATQFAAALTSALVETAPAVHRAAPPAPAGSTGRRRAPIGTWIPLGLALAALGVLAAGSIGFGWWLVHSRAPRLTPSPGPASPVPTPHPMSSPVSSRPSPVLPSLAPAPVAPAVVARPSPSPSPVAAVSTAPPAVDEAEEASGPFRLYCEARPRAEVFRKVKADDVADSVQDVKKAIGKRPGLTLADSPEKADAILQVLERGRTPAIVGMRQVRVRLVLGGESVELTGQDSFTGFNTWSGAAGGVADRVESWLRANQARVMRRRRDASGVTSR